ncbi:hypothetical protein [Gymnodinialimonas hymeniacidonis]|uniref:hypothetical protein n=1 Tax=Gymnodinialimonas hymeniacidonis TaxID=3126508 RepID=UPI0034C6313E
MRNTMIGLALACAGAFPSLADDLPQGSFLAAPFFANDTVLPRYVVVEIDGNDLTLRLRSPIAMDWAACEQEARCEFDLIAARAEVELEADQVALKTFEIVAEAGIDQPRFGPPSQRYTAPLLAVIDGATFLETGHGFTLNQGDQSLAFFAADQSAQEAIIPYVAALELSMRMSGGCEVAALAPLFTDPDPSAGETAFRHVLEGFARQWAISAELEALGDALFLPDDDPAAQQAANLQRAGALPTLLSAMTEAGQPVADRFAALLDGGALPFQPEDAQAYGDTLPDLVAFYDHVSATRPDMETVFCSDPSLGFIVRQRGG